VFRPHTVRSQARTRQRNVDSNEVYHEPIVPGVMKVVLEHLCADKDWAGEFDHKLTCERLTLCDFAVADATTANVFYKSGAGRAVKFASAAQIYGKAQARCRSTWGGCAPHFPSRLGRPCREGS